jgi:glycosyltransferase involved in cell wall biosynthesis
MKLCIATSSYPSRGENSFAGIFVRDFAKELVQQGIDVSVFCQDTGQPLLNDDGIEVITFPWAGKATPLSYLKPYHPRDVLNMLHLLQRGSKRLLQHCREGKVDFLLAMWALPAGHWVMNVQKRLGTPFAVWCLGSDIWIYGRFPILKRWVRKILRRSLCCFADGMSLVNEVRTLSGESCSFLPTTRNLPKEGLPELSFPPEKSHYLFIGRYHRNKGPDLLLEAIHLIDRERLSKIQFHFFGVGPLGGELKRKVIKYGLKDDVTIQGPVDEYTIAALLKQCAALIIPSRVESIPVILSDALQFDCDLIVTNVGDMGPLVKSYRAGRVVETVSPEAIEEAILNHFERNGNEYKEGRQKLYALFDLKESVRTFLKMIGSKW